MTHATSTTEPPAIGLIIVGDEILSGKRADKHMPKVIELLSARGLQLAWAEYVGDAPERITATLKRAFGSGDLVFSCGGIGATPDDHTRQCAGRALGVALELHPQAEVLIRQRMQDLAKEQGTAYEPDRPDNIHRLNMGVFPKGARLIPNPYNKIPGFYFAGHVPSGAGPSQAASAPLGGSDPHAVGERGGVYFVPGFPVMAWPMIEWVLDTHYAQLFREKAYAEKSVIVFGSMEATLTPLMEQIERDHPGVKVFSLPSVDHPVYGRHIDLGVKGAPEQVEPAYVQMRSGLEALGVKLGPELVR
jgi:molybdopterin-biosynthesis enzyme MoeA-like protein